MLHRLMVEVQLKKKEIRKRKKETHQDPDPGVGHVDVNHALARALLGPEVKIVLVEGGPLDQVTVEGYREGKRKVRRRGGGGEGRWWKCGERRRKRKGCYTHPLASGSKQVRVSSQSLE
jgi:hypothetical protein